MSNILIVLFVLIIFRGCGKENTLADNPLPADETIKVCNAPGSIESADFNKDKITDLAITSETDSSVTILLGKGNGEFTEAKGSPFFAGNLPNDMAISDFNNDGNPDLAFANHDRNYLTVLLGNENGNFAPAPGSPFPVDVVPHTHGLAAGDFNNDGRTDLVTDSWGNNKVEVLFGDSKTLFKTPGTFFNVGRHPYQRVRTGDVNNDGSIDIVTTNLDGDNATVLLGDGKGDFNEAAGSPFPCGDAPFGLAVGDVNGDRNPDLAIINSPASTADPSGINGLTVLLGDGTGKFLKMEGSPFEAGKIPNRIAVGDINGDGINDIAVSDNGGDKEYVYLMDRNGVASHYSVTVGNHPKGIALSDINNDGKADILVCNNADNTISIVLSK